MTPTIALILLVAAVVLAGVSLLESKGHNFAGWAALLIAVVLIFERGI